MVEDTVRKNNWEMAMRVMELLKWMGECTTVQVLEVVRAEQLFNFMGEDLCMGLREKVEDMHGSRRVSR